MEAGGFQQRVRQAANASFYFMHAGYRLRILLSEVFGAQLLLNALLNRSDSELAHCLGLSVDAVKQTWRRIYERLAGCVPNLFPIDERLPSERRGAEKRRHVLDYMRLHLEEIRPWSPAKSMRDPR